MRIGPYNEDLPAALDRLPEELLRHIAEERRLNLAMRALAHGRLAHTAAHAAAFAEWQNVHTARVKASIGLDDETYQGIDAYVSHVGVGAL